MALEFQIFGVNSRHVYHDYAGKYMVETRFRYYIKGDCACSAKQATVVTETVPRMEDLKAEAVRHFNK